MIQVSNLSFSYTRQPFISGMNFSVSAGEIFGFLGPSGAGKSTLQKILIGMLGTYQGSAVVNGIECKKRTKAFYEEIGVDFEFSTMYEKLTARENLRFFASLYEKKPRPMETLLRMAGLEQDGDKRVAQYSKGMKSRLNFIKALLHDPLLLCLDEPTSGLDPTNSRMMKDMILAEKSRGKTILLTTHNMQDAAELCDRVAFIVGGKICALDSPRNLIMAKGAATVTYTWVEEDGEHSADCPLGRLSSDGRLKGLIAGNRLQSIHGLCACGTASIRNHAGLASILSCECLHGDGLWRCAFPGGDFRGGGMDGGSAETFRTGCPGHVGQRGRWEVMRAVRLSFLQMLACLGRDRMLAVACAAPVLAGGLFRFGIPFLEAELTEWLSVPAIIAPYYRLIDVFFGMLSPAMFCFASAMVSLEEADERTAAYLFVTPLGRRGYLTARLGVPGAAAFLVTLVLLPAFRLTAFSAAALLLLAAAGALQGVIVALLILTVSSNKLEGMAVAKLSMLPVFGAAVPFFIKGDVQYALFWLPSYWMGRAAWGDELLSMVPAFALSGVWIWVLFRMYLRKKANCL